jgi:hypothetical protein
LRSTKADIQGLRAIWEERRHKLPPLKLQAQHVRQDISDIFAELALFPAGASVDYSNLMAAGKSTSPKLKGSHPSTSKIPHLPKFPQCEVYVLAIGAFWVEYPCIASRLHWVKSSICLKAKLVAG